MGGSSCGGPDAVTGVPDGMIPGVINGGYLFMGANTGTRGVPVVGAGVGTVTVLAEVPASGVLNKAPVGGARGATPDAGVGGPLIVGVVSLCLTTCSVCNPSVASSFTLVVRGKCSFGVVVCPVGGAVTTVPPTAMGGGNP